MNNNLCSVSSLVEYYVDSNMPSHEEFFKQIEEKFDYEIAMQTNDLTKKICDAAILAQKHIEHLNEVIRDIRNIESRKTQAELIKRNCQTTWAYAFSILDGKPITNSLWVKLINQKLEVISS